MVIYVLAGTGCLLLLRFWLLSNWPATPRRFLLLVLAALALVPAYPSEDATTLAPASIVAVFNLLFAGGWDAASVPFLTLALGVIAALVLGLIYHLVWGRRSSIEE
ncbi:hypothetical protein NOR51B_519 [Luminiphilus syltensis NOR5-1B]|uniref:Uncharacterized protein n=1 Tax=Luminiphilus syltensis NOR5-1B TaxID=565045 RepID=B8KYG7_9GAMM|nr:hypothetical protein [Luminiphilus syltensis]EED34581.1 hypothetical protein NOR51B_519 [Luminiphilus syltensis NOR5-1B]